MVIPTQFKATQLVVAIAAWAIPGGLALKLLDFNLSILLLDFNQNNIILLFDNNALFLLGNIML